MSILVGSAYSQFGLDISPLRKAAQEARQILGQIEKDAGALAARKRPLKLIDGAGTAADARGIQQLGREADRALKSFERLDAQFRQRERQQQRLADSAIRAATAQQDYARALDLVDRELATTNKDTERYNALLAKQAQLARQAARSQPAPVAPAGGGGGGLRGTLTAFGGAAGGPLGALAGAAGPAAIAGLAVGAGASALAGAAEQSRAFRAAEQDLRILAGTQARYNLLLQQARQNQVLFGGSITENLEPLQQLIFISNRTGASLQDLNESARLLGATNSKEGVGGAGFAIGEFLSGDTTSIVERFNLPRQAVNDLKNAEVDTATKLQLLNQLILTQGDIAEVLAQKLKSPQAQYNQVNQSMERITIAAGDVVNAFGGIGAAALNNGLHVGQFEISLTTFARSAEEVAAGYSAYIRALAEGKTQGEALLIGAQAQRDARQQEAQATDQATQAVNQNTQATQQQESALLKSLAAQQASTIEASNLTIAQADLEAAALRVAIGASTQAAEVAALRAKYPELGDQADILISRQVVLAAATDEATAALRRQQLAGQEAQTRDLTGGRGVVPGAPGQRGNTVADFEAEIERRRRLAEAQARQTEATETTAQRVTRLRKAEADAARQHGRDSAEYVDAQTARLQAEKQLTSERDKAATRAVSAKRKETNALARETDQQARDLERQVQQQQEAYQRLTRAHEDYLTGRARSQEDFERQYRRLLAEGKRFEAQQLKEEFGRTQARSAEDFARQQQRTREDAGLANAAVGAAPVAQIARDARLSATAAPATSIAGGGPASTGAGTTGAITLTIRFAPIQLIADGRALAEVVYPDVEARLAAAVTEIDIASPPRIGPTTAVSGPRP